MIASSSKQKNKQSTIDSLIGPIINYRMERTVTMQKLSQRNHEFINKNYCKSTLSSNEIKTMKTYSLAIADISTEYFSF